MRSADARAAELIDPGVLRAARCRARTAIARNGIFAPCDFDDVAQDLLVAVLERLPRYDHRRASMATFADRICASRVIDVARARRQRLHTFVTRRDTDTAPSEPSVAAEAHLPNVEGVGRRVDVSRVVDGLDADDAAFCRLVATGTVAEAATALGVSRASAYRRLVRLRDPFSDLRSYVTEEDQHGGPGQGAGPTAPARTDVGSHPARQVTGEGR